MNCTYIRKFVISRLHRIIVMMNPRREINRYFRKAYGHKANLDSPRNLMEKIYWMELHCDTSLWTKCADKYRMREYVEECGLDEHLPVLYGKWEESDDVQSVAEHGKRKKICSEIWLRQVPDRSTL